MTTSTSHSTRAPAAPLVESEERSPGGPHVIMRFPDLRTSYTKHPIHRERDNGNTSTVRASVLGVVARLRPFLARGWGKLGIGLLIVALSQGVFLSIFLTLSEPSAHHTPSLPTTSLSVGFGPARSDASSDKNLTITEPSLAAKFAPLSEPGKTGVIPLDLHPGVSSGPRSTPEFGGSKLGASEDVPPWDLSPAPAKDISLASPAPQQAAPESKDESKAVKAATRLRGVIQ